MNAYVSRINFDIDAIDMEDYVGQPALAGTDNEPADLATVAELYDMADAARRRPQPEAKPEAKPAMARPIIFDMEAVMMAHADGDTGLTDDEFVAFCNGLAAEPF